MEEVARLIVHVIGDEWLPSASDPSDDSLLACLQGEALLVQDLPTKPRARLECRSSRFRVDLKDVDEIVSEVVGDQVHYARQQGVEV